jgi:dipeptidyl aminopeptidase/acylaminoacyl peptidase
MGSGEPQHRSRVPWALALAVGLASWLAGYVIHAARVNRIPKQVVEVRRLTYSLGFKETPAISPDGKSVAFVAMSRGNRQIWVRSLGGDSLWAITKDDADSSGPRWSADSSHLIYFTAGNIWEISAQGGSARKLLGSLGPGDLSHDGRKLAFLQSRDGIVELAVSTDDASRSHAVGKLNGVTDWNTYSNLRWSPDDKKLAFMNDDHGHTSLLVADLSGGEPVQVAGRGVTIRGFAWAPDNSGLIVGLAKGNYAEGSVPAPFDEFPVFNLWFIPRVENSTTSQLTFGELSYEFPDINAGGSLVVSRRGYAPRFDTDIVMFSGLKW